MKRAIIGILLIVSVISLGAKKPKKDETVNIEARMQRMEKIESYRAKKDVAWHKTEYNKTLKYLNKTNK